MALRYVARLAIAFAGTWFAAAAYASSCNTNDPFCNPAPSDPCGSYAGREYSNCRYSIAQCPNMAGPVLQTCLSHQVAQTGSATLTTTNTSTSTGTNHATTFTASKYNDGLFGEQANTGNQVGDYTVQMNGTSVQTSETIGSGTFLSQNDAFTAQNNVMIGCAGTNIAGRTDTLCASSPNDPQCTGMSSSLGNATTCSQFGPPDPQGRPTCLRYGGFGFSLDEWLVFSQQYYNGMTACFRVGDAVDVTGSTADSNRMVNRAARLQALNEFAAIPTAGQLGNGTGASTSNVTGQINQSQITSGGKPQVVPLWQSIAAKFDDGAAALGFERGELVRRSVTGDTFSNAFSESPFGTALAKSMRESAEVALNDPSATLEKVQERIAAANPATGDDSPAAAEAAGAKEPQPHQANVSAEKSATPSVSAHAPRDFSIGERSALMMRAPASTAVSSSAPPLTERELAYERAGLGGSARAGAAAGASQGSAARAAEITLFQRVTLSYRRHALELKGYDESKTARDVRDTEKPAFFRDL